LLFCRYFVALYIPDQYIFAKTQSSNFSKNLQANILYNYRWDYCGNSDDATAVYNYLVQGQLPRGPGIVTIVYLLESYSPSRYCRGRRIKGMAIYLIKEKTANLMSGEHLNIFAY
jgi:hypothetical protein